MPRGIVAAAAAFLTTVCAWSLFGSAEPVTLPPGSGAADTARILKSEGIIGSPRVFRGLAKLTRLDRSIKPGTYRLRRHMSSVEALWRLSRGKAEWVRVVIPEGFSAKQIAERLEAGGVTSAADFDAYVRRNRLEGYLFPTTYFLGLGMEAEAVAHRMRQEFKRIVEPEYEKAKGRLSLEQTVILASIVEREAALPAEKPMVAAVYLNRLTKRMRLEADPTVQYALGKGAWKKRLSRADLQIDSPLNTYLHFGLPPTPICSPGLAAIEAVLRPAQTKALYFVADHTGGHTFSEDYVSHRRAVAKARKKKKGV